MADYYDIDDYLSEGETVTVDFLYDCKGLSFIDSTSHTKQNDIKKGHKADLPLHIANQLFRIGALNLKVHKGFQNSFKRKLMGDPLVVNL